MLLVLNMVKLEEKGVWVPIEVRSGDIIEKTTGLLNTGYRTEEPYIAIPGSLSRRLNISPKGIEETAPSLLKTDSEVEVRVVTEDKASDWVRAKVHIHVFRAYILISASLASSLEIGIYDTFEGLWFFRNEGLNRIRKSAKPVLYPVKI